MLSSEIQNNMIYKNWSNDFVNKVNNSMPKYQNIDVFAAIPK